ncbi:MAG: MASE1 domain-containing protein [Pseudomonadota bacterium]
MPAAPAHLLPARQDLVPVLVLALLYFAGGCFGLAMPVTAGPASLIWPPAGIAVAALLLFGTRLWPGIWLGAFAVNLTLDLPLVTVLIIATGNTLEALLARWLLGTGNNHTGQFSMVRRTRVFILPTTVVAPLVAASFGTLAHVLTDHTFDDAARVFLLWWLGDLMGMLLITPILVLLLERWRWRNQPDRQMRWGRTGRQKEWLVVVTLALLVSVFIYAGSLPQPVAARIGFVPYLFVLWTALRMSPLATVSVSLAISFGAIAGTLGNGHTPDLVGEVIYLYAFLFVQTAAALLVAAVVHERRQALADAEAAREQAQQASLQKSRFLANMSHEIRTPLNGIIGMATLLDDDIVDQKPRDKLRIIQSSADSLLNVLNDIIDHARIESGKLAMVPRTFAVAPLVRDVVGLFQGQAELKRIELRARIDGDLPAEMTTDDSRLRQVLVNVVSNAVKFTEQGTVLLHAGRDPDRPDTVTFTVTDTGIGIAPEMMARVFEPFIQADGSSTRRHGGSGLGLTISQQLVENMGGEMKIRSTPGAGTEVVIRIPVHPGKTEPLTHPE